MRSLRSGRNADVIISKCTKTSSKSEDSKMFNKRSKPGKSETRNKRQVLADKTNSSDVDTNSSSNISTGIISSRPKRIYNLPAKYQDHELSPIKSYRPECSSTPHSVNSRSAKKTVIGNGKKSSHNTNADLKEIKSPTEIQTISTKRTSKNTLKPKSATNKCEETTDGKSVQDISKQAGDTGVPPKSLTPIYKKSLQKSSNLNHKNIGEEKVATPMCKKKVMLLEKPKIQTPDRMALYEFDFDPKEEPIQIKKKRIRKKPTATKKKKTKSDNAKDDAALQDLIEQLKRIQEKQKWKKLLEKRKMLQATSEVTKKVSETRVQSVTTTTVGKVSQPSDDHHNVLECLSLIPGPSRSLSPVLSRPASPLLINSYTRESCTSTGNNISRRSDVFGGSPVASSSMIVKSAHKAAASPWRVEGGAGTRKWPLNFHVKPSMTPSYDKDTVHVIDFPRNMEQDSESDQRKHVYTNIYTNSHNDGEQKTLSNWKQTSILSFYEESLKKSTKKRSLSPKKAVESYNFEDLVPETNEMCSSLNESQEKHVEPEKEKITVENCFGFDDFAELDQENVSPTKKTKLQNINTIRGIFRRAKKRAGVLEEIKQPLDKNIPMRVIPADILNIMEKHKFMEDIEEPQKLPEVEQLDVNAESESEDEMGVLDQSLPLEHTHNQGMELMAEPFEPELAHLSKETRRSYGTRKRGQLTFLLPEATKDKESDYNSDDSSASLERNKKAAKKKKKQNTKTKKEEKEVDEWAAGFNSMLEDVEEFPLCVE